MKLFINNNDNQKKERQFLRNKRNSIKVKTNYMKFFQIVFKKKKMKKHTKCLAKKKYIYKKRNALFFY